MVGILRVESWRYPGSLGKSKKSLRRGSGMKRLLVLALAVVFGVVMFAGAQYPGDFEDVTLSGEATIRVHQWLDAEFTAGEFDIYDYTDEDDEPIDIDLGDLWLDSNADVDVSVSVDLGDLAGYISYASIYPDGAVDADNQNYDVILEDATVDPNTPADEYTVTVTITLNPTVTF
jgi:hypothetical protein